MSFALQNATLIQTFGILVEDMHLYLCTHLTQLFTVTENRTRLDFIWKLFMCIFMCMCPLYAFHDGMCNVCFIAPGGRELMWMGLYAQLNENVSVISNHVTPLYHIVKHAYGEKLWCSWAHWRHIFPACSYTFQWALFGGMCPVNLYREISRRHSN